MYFGASKPDDAAEQAEAQGANLQNLMTGERTWGSCSRRFVRTMSCCFDSFEKIEARSSLMLQRKFQFSILPKRTHNPDESVDRLHCGLTIPSVSVRGACCPWQFTNIAGVLSCERSTEVDRQLCNECDPHAVQGNGWGGACPLPSYLSLLVSVLNF